MLVPSASSHTHQVLLESLCTPLGQQDVGGPVLPLPLMTLDPRVRGTALPATSWELTTSPESAGFPTPFSFQEISCILRIMSWRRQWQPTPVFLPGESQGWGSLVGCSPWVAKSQTRLSDFTFTFHFHALEKEMATHSSVLAWRIPGTGEPGGQPSMGLHRVGRD